MVAALLSPSKEPASDQHLEQLAAHVVAELPDFVSKWVRQFCRGSASDVTRTYHVLGHAFQRSAVYRRATLLLDPAERSRLDWFIVRQLIERESR